MPALRGIPAGRIGDFRLYLAKEKNEESNTSELEGRSRSTRSNESESIRSLMKKRPVPNH